MSSPEKITINDVSARLSQILGSRLALEMGSFEELITHLLAATREQLAMEVAFVSQFIAGRRVFRYVDAVKEIEAVTVGGGEPLGESYCQRVVEGRLPELIHNAQELDAAADLEATFTLPVGAHISVPVRLSNGTVYGTFCTFSRQGNDSLTERDLAYVRVFADVTAALIESHWTNIASNRELHEKLTRLLDDDELQIHLQPVVDLHTQQTRGYEALSRVADPDWRPDILFADAERVGLDGDFGARSVQKALETLSLIPAGQFLSINISPQFALSRDLPTLFDNVPLERVILEVTEHVAVFDYHGVRRALQPLRDRGARLAVDDAGAGYASFRHILALQPEVIKLDISLIRNIHADEERQALTEALVAFARQRGYTLIAEGIETGEELEALRKLGLHTGQGFYFLPPRPVDQCLFNP